MIDPVLLAAGWSEGHIRREVQVTPGGVYLVGNEPQRRRPTWADYVLSVDGVPLAVIEAKSANHHAAAGLQQARAYAEMLDTRFAYSTNGHQIVEFDYVASTETTREISEFPSPTELLERSGQTESSTRHRGANPLFYPYAAAAGMQPRYYQDVAIRRVISSVISGRDRLLLTLATGTGKTYIASQIVWKLQRSKVINRVLFITDRTFLRDQAYNAFSFFADAGGDPRYVVDGELGKHAAIYFGMYQTLYSERNGSQLFRELPADFFDLIVIDECHRSGFGTWREILDYFDTAVQLGLTATPKRRDNVDTYAYFGEPVYSYSLGQGIQDGFLATYKVHKVNTNLNAAGGINVEDAVIAGADLFIPEGSDTLKPFYSISEFEQTISLPDWTDRLCEHLAATINAGNPMDRTIVFCVNMDHALHVRQRMQNHFAHLGFNDYAVRIVSEEPYGSGLLEDFRNSRTRTPVLATTVDLLTTGVDIPSVKNIVFFRPISSPLVFKQIIGRGSRIDDSTEKSWFRIIDYTNATRLFDEWDRPWSDPEEVPPKPWQNALRIQAIDAQSSELTDGAWAIAVTAPNEQQRFVDVGRVLVGTGLPATTVTVHIGAPGYTTRQVRLATTNEASSEPAVIELRRIKERAEQIRLEGVRVEISDEVILTVDSDGRSMTIDEYRGYSKEILLEQFGDLEELRVTWLNPNRRIELIHHLNDRGVNLQFLGELGGVSDADAKDVIGHLAFSQPLVRRTERADALLNHASHWLATMPVDQRGIALALVDAYRDGGIDQLDRRILQLDRFTPYGGPIGVIRTLGGSEKLDELLGQIQDRLYPASEAA